jgi:hypothetical protein
MNTHRMLCFGRNDESDNAAIVVEESAMSESERQKFAQLQEANATVFTDVNAAGVSYGSTVGHLLTLHLKAKVAQAKWLEGYQVIIAEVIRTYGDGTPSHVVS